MEAVEAVVEMVDNELKTITTVIVLRRNGTNWFRFPGMETVVSILPEQVGDGELYNKFVIPVEHIFTALPKPAAQKSSINLWKVWRTFGGRNKVSHGL